MLAVILAAGTSSRLRPLTDHTPKALIQLCGRSMLQRSIENLLAVGVRDLVIVTGYLGDQIPAAVKAWYPELAVRYFANPDYATKGNGNSLLHTRAAVAGHDFLLLDGDVVYQPGVVQALLDSAHPDVIAVHRSRVLGDEEMKVALDEHGHVTLISKEIPPARAAGESIGIERFGAETSARLFETLADRIERRGCVADHYEHSFQELADRGLAKLGVVEVDAWYCEDVDDPADVVRVEAELRANGLA